MTDQDSESECQNEKQGAEIDGSALQDIGRAGTEDLIRHSAPESGSQTFLFGPLHQDEQGHQETHNNEEHQKEVDADGKPVNRS